MEYSINEIPRPVRRRLKRIMKNSKDIKHARRAHAMLLLYEGYTVSDVARLLCAARSAIGHWRARLVQFGEAGLVPERPERKPTTVNDNVGAHVVMLIAKEPSDYGYLPSRWTTEMLANQVVKDLGIPIHASTVRRLLPKLGICWNRARPTLCIKDPNKTAKTQWGQIPLLYGYFSALTS